MPSCADCSFFGGDACHLNPPFINTAGHESSYTWPRVKSTDWCANWNCWPGAKVPPTGSSNISWGWPIPTGGSDGDYYIKYAYGVGAPPIAVYQKQSGSWNQIATLT